MSSRSVPSGRASERVRRVIGVAVSSDGRQVSGALIAARGCGCDAQVEIAACAAAPTSRTAATLINQLRGESVPVGALASLAGELAGTEALVVASLVKQAAVRAEDVLAVGVHDPGLWHFGTSATPYYAALSDGAKLAELSGISVVDAFAARDLAAGGQGGPLAAYGYWLLLRDPLRVRVLVDLGRTVRMTFLPPWGGRLVGGEVLSFDVGPGTALLDLLAQKLTAGRERYDPGGRLAVQGRQIAELMAHWSADPYFERSIPRWHPQGVRPERFLSDVMPLAVKHGWSVRDMLCTATHFIADRVAAALRRHVARQTRVDEILLGGGGKQNGMLLGELRARLGETPLRRVSDCGVPSETLDSAATAVLALMCVDQTPASHAALTGTAEARVVGRLTPAAGPGWRRLAAELAGWAHEDGRVRLAG